MKMVDINIRAATAGEVVYGVIVLQEKEANHWHTKELIEISSMGVSAQRSMLLEENERIIVEARSNIVEVLDPKQNVVVRKVVDVTQEMRAELMAPFLSGGPPPGPLPPGDESQIGVWRDWGFEADWSRTGKRYRIY